jgi:hypothetical protein
MILLGIIIVGFDVTDQPLIRSFAEGKRPLGRSRHRWLDNIKMDLREIG